MGEDDTKKPAAAGAVQQEQEQLEDPLPPYGDFQRGIYTAGIISDGSQLPPVTTNPTLLEAHAERVMKPEAFGYVAGSAGAGLTDEANRAAFRRWAIKPRFLRPTTPRDLSVTLFGRTYESPLLMAPIGVKNIAHQDAEPGVARACADLRVPYIMSSASSVPIEDVAAASGAGPRWYQLYWPRTERLTASLLSRARKSGFSVLVVTLDTFGMGWRPRDLDAAYLPQGVGVGNAPAFSDPVFREMFAAESEGDTPEDNPIGASVLWASEAFSGISHSWEELKELRRLWGDGPILLKGVLTAEDAKLALEHGMDGVIVSNHGGRQVDGSVASLDALPEVVAAVGDKTTVIFDSGVRTGADIIKALSLGAKAVAVGRPVIYGLAIAGEEGARHVLAGLLGELDVTMGLSGVQKIAELNSDVLTPVPGHEHAQGRRQLKL